MSRRPSSRRHSPSPVVRFPILTRSIAMARRNPIRFWTSVAVLLGAVPGAMLGLSYLDGKFEPYYYARHEWVRVQEEPMVKLQETHEYGLNYLILKDQRQALKDARDELARHPDSTTAPAVIDRLEKSIKKRQDSLDKGQR